MNWEAIGAVSEAIGVVAILISLAYLAIQIRQSTREFSRGIEANQLAAFERNIDSANRIREWLGMNNPDWRSEFQALVDQLLEATKQEK